MVLMAVTGSMAAFVIVAHDSDSLNSSMCVCFNMTVVQSVVIELVDLFLCVLSSRGQSSSTLWNAFFFILELLG